MGSRPKILLVNTLYPPFVVGGAELSVATLASGLADTCDVTVLSTSETRHITTETDAHVQVIRIPTYNVGTWNSPPQTKLGKAFSLFADAINPLRDHSVRQIFDQVGPDLLHTHNLAGLSTQIWAHAAKNGCHTVHTLRDRRLLCPFHMNRHGICETRCGLCKTYNIRRDIHSRHVQTIIGISKNVLDAHLREGLFPKASTTCVIHNGVSDSSSGPRKFNPPYTFGYIGTLSEGKGIRHLLQAWQDISNDNTLLVAGDGQASYVRSLRNTYSQPDIRFLGRVTTESFFREIDLLVVPSLCREAFGRVVIEAYSAGVPVIASNRGGLREIVCDNKTGWLYDGASQSSLKSALSLATSCSPQDLDMLSTHARDTYLKQYTQKHTVQKHLELYNKLLFL